MSVESPSRVEPPPRHLNAVLLASALVVAAGILTAQLFVPPVVGLADNRDYERIMGYAGFQHTTAVDAERYFSYVRTRFAVVTPGWFRGGYHSSETLLAFLARGVHGAVSGQPVFDLRLLGAIHAALFLLALAGLIRACRDLAAPAQAIAAALLVFVFTDVGYVAPFNSFYSQTASLLFLLLTAAIAAEAVRRGKLSGGWLLAYFACSLLFVGSKPQEKLAAPLLALFGMRLAGVRWAGAWKRAASWLGLGLLAFSVWYGRRTPYTLREATLYQVVFDDLLAHSTAPAADVAELGLDPDWAKYTGTNPYAPDSPLLDSSFRIRFLHQVGYRRVLRFYLRHPGRLAERGERASAQIWSLRPTFGNFERSSAHPEPALATRFSLWSRTRGRLGNHPLLWITLLLGGNLAAALATHRRSNLTGRLFREGIITMVLMAGLALVVCTLAQAPTDLSRALYAYHALCDLLLIADAVWIAETLAVRTKTHVTPAGASSDRMQENSLPKGDDMSRIGTGLLRFSVAFLFAATALAQGAASTKPAASHKSSPGKPVIWPAGEMKWVDAANSPPGVQQVVLWGDPTKGRFGAMTRFPAGFVAPLHSHSATLRSVVVSGTVIHGPEGKPEVRLGPGSYLVDPAGYRHTTACDKASECVFFMEGDGKFDLVMADTK